MNKHVVRQIEEVVRDWQQQISSAVEALKAKSPVGEGPLAEIDFWREKNASLSALIEQVPVPLVTKQAGNAPSRRYI